MNEFKIIASHNAHEEPDVISFVLSVVSEGSYLPLHSWEFQDESFDVLPYAIEAYRSYIEQPDINMKLMATNLGRILGFEMDPSKGWEGFFKDMASHIATEDLEDCIHNINLLPLKNELKNELKMRGEIKNDRNN